MTSTIKIYPDLTMLMTRLLRLKVVEPSDLDELLADESEESV
jgi:hypothetical protein